MSAHPQRYWLFKSEPSTFSIADLQASPQKTTLWDGVRNHQARNFLRDAMAMGDEGFFYHSSCPQPGIVGHVRVVSEALPDPTALDPNSPYFDAKAAATGKNPWIVRRVLWLATFKHPLLLSQLRACPALAKMPLLARGNRLSITPVSPQEWKTLFALQESM